MHIDTYNGNIRVALRVYFIVVVALLGIIGSQCCKCAAKVDLLKGRTVRLHRMTGWLRARDVFLCLWKLHRLPGGWWLGLMMVITSIITLTSDLAVAYFVQPVDALGLCLFSKGLVMNWDIREAFSVPPQNGYPSLIASNAQISSIMNGCFDGIYRKIPGEDGSNYCATSDDILGYWQCDDSGKDREFASNVTAEEVSSALLQDGLQWDSLQSNAYYDSNNRSTHLVIWSTNADDDVAASFDVQVSVDLNSTLTSTKYMKTYRCSIHENNDEGAVAKILEQMYSVTALRDWVDSLEGILYQGDGTSVNEDPDQLVAEQLNVMTMVQGGSNSVLAPALATDSPYYSCLVEKTDVSPAIVGLAAFAALILAITTLYWVFLLCLLGKQALPRVFNRSARAMSTVKPVPDSILSWMLQASRENAHAVDVTSEGVGIPREERDLRHWGFAVVDSSSGTARTVRNRGLVVQQDFEHQHLQANKK